MIEIRDELSGDVPSVRRVNDLAFGQPDEGEIVDRIRAAVPDEILSLVAVEDDEVVGHILFSEATIDGPMPARGMGLAPLAVLPGRQRKGIGTRLVETGLARLRDVGCTFVIVLGHPEYYPRFGFAPASRMGIACPWDGIPDEVFMAILLDHAVMAGIHGVARYRAEFDDAV